MIQYNRRYDTGAKGVNKVGVSSNIPVQNTTQNEWKTLSINRASTSNVKIISDQIAPGIIVTYNSGKATLHILKTRLSDTLSDLTRITTNFTNLLERHGEISGSTPSLKAMRIMFMTLLRNPGIALEDKLKIKELRLKVENINLKKPDNPKIQELIKISTDGKELAIKINLEKVGPISRMLRMFSTDLDQADTWARYNYKIEFSLLDDDKSNFLTGLSHKLGHKLKQMQSVSTLLTPMLGALWLRASYLPNKLIPNLFENNYLQTLMELGSEILPLGVVGAFSYIAYDRLMRTNLRNK